MTLIDAHRDAQSGQSEVSRFCATLVIAGTAIRLLRPAQSDTVKPSLHPDGGFIMSDSSKSYAVLALAGLMLAGVVYAQSGKAVEFGQKLFRIKKA